MILLGTPYRQMMSLLMNLAVFFIVIVDKDVAFYPFGEVVDSHYDVLMSIYCLSGHGPYYVNTPHREWPRGSQIV